MTRRSTFRSEHTGDASRDRAQGNERDFQKFAKGEIADSAWFHGVGIRRVHMQDTDYTITPDDLRAASIIFTGTLSAPRNVILPTVTDARAFQRWFDNSTGQDLTFINTAGSDVITSGSGTGFIVVTADGPVVWQ